VGQGEPVAPESLVRTLAGMLTDPDSTPAAVESEPVRLQEFDLQLPDLEAPLDIPPELLESPVERLPRRTLFDRARAAAPLVLGPVVLASALFAYRVWSKRPAPREMPATRSIARAPAPAKAAEPDVPHAAVADQEPAEEPPSAARAFTPAAARTAILMATFQGDDRTAASIQLLTDAGFSAF